MEFFVHWLMIVSLVLLAGMSPGPDFVMAVRNSLSYSRRAGVFTAIGFGLGVLVHVTYCIIGIAALISQSIMLFNIIKYAGAAYLCYIGWQALRSAGFAAQDEANAETAKVRTMSPRRALTSGFITNLLNPKATMFFLALFTQVIDPHTPITAQIIYGVSAAAVIMLWFSFVALVLTHGPVKKKFLGFSKYIDRVCGGVMMALGLKLAFTRITP